MLRAIGLSQQAADDVVNFIVDLLFGKGKSTSKASALAVPIEAPTYPNCGHVMVLRAAKNGVKAGNHFWGCSNYPTYRSIRQYHK